MKSTTRPRRRQELLDQPPPADDQAERALLGGLLAVPWDLDALDTLPADALRDYRHRAIWAAAQAVAAAGGDVGIGTVANELHRRGQFLQIGAGYLLRLWECGRPGYGVGLARRITRAAALREAVETGCEIIQAAHRGDGERLAECGARITALAQALDAGVAPRRRRLQLSTGNHPGGVIP